MGIFFEFCYFFRSQLPNTRVRSHRADVPPESLYYLCVYGMIPSLDDLDETEIAADLSQRKCDSVVVIAIITCSLCNDKRHKPVNYWIRHLQIASDKKV